MNLEAERAVLGSIFLDNDKLNEVKPFLEPSDFCDDSCRMVYIAFLHVAFSGREIDPVTVADFLIRHRQFNRIGGTEKLRWITESVFHSENARYYAGIIRHHSERPEDQPDSSFDYHEYLASPEWQIKRSAMLWICENRCQICNSSRDQSILDTHHRTYDRIGNERPGDLIVLCRDCHTLFHENGRLARV